MKSRHGHTLVELLFCLLIAGILLSFAIPSFVSTVERSRQTEAVNQLLGALHYARSTAVMERKVVGICSGESTCSDDARWVDQLLVFIDDNRNGHLDTNEKLLRGFPLPADQSWTWKNFRRKRYLQFKPDGTTLALNGTFTLCREGEAIRQLVINLTGRVRTRAPSANAQCD
ncbi:type IV fimbrial biogenesis protein FimT [Metapseudomonas resinovorans]|uniref:GspH/FimT family pseudopilin n=1 Tax=Metapseudomonas resinovorans TaxID=53412 RepID=UPI003D1DB65A